MIRPLKPNDFHTDSTEVKEEEEGERMSVDTSASTVESKSEADPNDPNACKDEPVDNNQDNKQQPATASQKPPESSDPSSRTTLPSSQTSKESSGGVREVRTGVQYHPDVFEQTVTQKETQANLPGVSHDAVVEVAVESDDIVAEADNFSVYSQPAVLRIISPNKEPSSQPISGIANASDEEPVAKSIASTSEQVPVPKAIGKSLEHPSNSVATGKRLSYSTEGKTVKSKPAGVPVRKGNTEPPAQVPDSHRSVINTCDLYGRRFTQSSYAEIHQDLCRETQFNSNNIVDRIFENVSESPEDVNIEDPRNSNSVARSGTSLHGNNHDVSADLHTHSSVQEIHLETQSFPLDCFDDDDDVCDES